MILESHSPKQTQKIAADLARKIIKTKKGAIVALEGELGAGKTTFIQGFAKALGIKSKIKSPTFNIIKKYRIPKNVKNRAFNISNGYSPVAIRYIYHIDCYRLKDHKEAIPLGTKDIFEEPDCFVLIEWPERIKKILPKKHITVHIDHVSENERKVTIK